MRNIFKLPLAIIAALCLIAAPTWGAKAEASAMADLSIAAADLSVSRPTITGGDSVTFKALVRNPGSATAGSFKIKLYLGDTLIYTKSVTSLAKGASNLASKTYTIPTSLGGKVVFRAVADADENIKEDNETNNVAEKTLEIAKAMPDIQVTADALSYSPKILKGGDKVNLRAVIRNKGTATAKNIKVDFYFGGKPVYRKILASLAKNGSSAVTYTHTIPTNSRGPSIFRVEADPENTIAENDDKNNGAQLAINVNQAQIDLLIESIRVSPQKPKVGQLATITVKIKNSGNTQAKDVKLDFYANNSSQTPTHSTVISKISKSATATRTFKWTATNTIQPAVGYTLRADVDPDNRIDETNEANNIKTHSLNLTAPDLIAEPGINFYQRGPHYAGVKLSQWTRVRNNDVMAVSGAKIALYYYVGTNSENPIKIAEQQLSALGKKTYTDVYLDGFLPQDYPLGTILNVLVKADSTDSVVETDEANNILVGTRTVTEKPRTVQYPYLRIYVYDDDGNPKNGATVKLTNKATGAVETKTTGNESFYLSNGNVIFEARPNTANYSVEVAYPGFRTVTQDLAYDKNHDSTGELTIHLDKKALVTGRITNQTGAPQAGAIIRLEGTGLETTTDAQGKYGFLLNGGTYDFRFIKSGYARLVDTGRQIAPLSNVTLDKILSPATVAYVSGTITDDDGNPLQNVDVFVNGNVIRVTGAQGKFDFSPTPGTKTLKFKKPGYVTVEFSQAVSAGEEYDFSFTMYKPNTENHVERGTSFVAWHQHEGTPANAFFIPEYNVDVWWGIGRFKMGLDSTKTDGSTKLTKLTVQAKGQGWECHKVEGEGDIETSAIDIPITIAAGGCSDKLTQINVSKVAIYSNGVEVWSDDSNWTSASDSLNVKTQVYSLPNLQVAWNNDFQVKIWARVQKKSVIGTDGDGAGALVGYHLDKKLVTWYPQKPPTTKISTSWGQIGGYFLGILDNPVNIVAGFTDMFTVEQFNQFEMQDLLPAQYPE